MRSLHSPARRTCALAPALAAAAALLAVACAPAAAQRAPRAVEPRAQGGATSSGVGSAPAASGGAPRTAGDVPGVVGRSPIHAGEVVSRAGLVPQLVRIGAGDTVTAQLPHPGAPTPPDRTVVLWVGTAERPPERKPAVPPSPPATSSPAAAVAHPPGVPTSPVAPAPGPGPAASAPAPPSGPRSNIRTLPAAPAGTTLAGPASWYGAELAGRPTACGGTFDPAGLTLASTELRCGTRVLVTGPSGASVVATVTDWGPAEWTQRRFDLSHATFAALHPPAAGVIPVSLEVLGG